MLKCNGLFISMTIEQCNLISSFIYLCNGLLSSLQNNCKRTVQSSWEKLWLSQKSDTNMVTSGGLEMRCDHFIKKKIRKL